jgi:branched-chain amino acid transport system substrate-binding protein
VSIKDFLVGRASLVAALCIGMVAGGVAAKDLVVAQVAPFGGNLAVAGRDFNLGAMIAFDEVNVAGGVSGQQVRLVSRDDGYRPAETVRHLTALVENEAPVALIGLWGADSVRALLADKTIERAGLAVVGVRSGDTLLRGEKILFHLRASYRDEVTRMVDQIATMSVKRVAVVHEDEPFAREALGIAREGLKARSIELVSVATLKRDSLEVSAAVDTLAKLEPQAVFVFASTNAAAAFIKPFRQRKASAFVLTTSSVEAENLVNQITPEFARGVSVAQSVPNPYKATAPIARSMRSRMKSLGIAEDRANFASLEGYISARIVIEALRRAGRDPKPAQVATALESMRRFDLGGFVIDFGPGQHEGSQFVDLSVISADGKVRQ